MDINISSQIVVQTAAQWAADNTVYSAKRILVTSDVYYGSTDQRKFKIADGVQTWSNLDYVPIAQTLAEVLANGSLTNEQYITSNNQYANLWLLNTSSHLRWDSNTTYGQVVIDNTKIEAEHDLRIDINAPTINLPQSTASRIVETDASKNLTYAAKNTAYNLNLGTTAGTVLEGNRITQVITNGVTDKAPSEDAVYDALALKLDTNNSAVTDARDLKYAAYSNTDSSHTGNTNETYLKGLLVPNLTTNSTLDILGLLNKTGTAGNITWNLYYNTTNDLTGSPVKISTSTQTAAQLYGGKFIRTIINKNSLTDNYIYRANVTSINDFTQNASAMTSLGVDLSSKYLIITATLANSGDTAILSAFQLIHTRP